MSEGLLLRPDLLKALMDAADDPLQFDPQAASRNTKTMGVRCTRSNNATCS